MKVGDLVHSPLYPLWGMGFVVATIGTTRRFARVSWISGEFHSQDWVDADDLEVL